MTTAWPKRPSPLARDQGHTIICPSFGFGNWHNPGGTDTIHRALKPNGQLIVIKFERIPGTSRDWVLNHVRADRNVFQREIVEAGFKSLEELAIGALKENYFIKFRKR